MSHQAGMAFPARYSIAPFGGLSGRVRPAADSTGLAYARRDVRYRIVTSGLRILGFLAGYPVFYPDFRARFTPRCASVIRPRQIGQAGRPPPRRGRRAPARRRLRRRPAWTGGSGRRTSPGRAGRWPPPPAARRPALDGPPPPRGWARRPTRKPGGPRTTRSWPATAWRGARWW